MPEVTLEEVKKTIDGINSATHAFREEMSKKIPDPEKVAKMEACVAAHDAQIQKFVADGEAKEAKNKALQDHVNALEAKVNRSDFGTGGGNSAKAQREELLAERKAAFEAFIRYDSPALVKDAQVAERKWEKFREEKGLKKMEAKALSLSDDTAGGVLAPPDYAAGIIKAEVLFSPMRSICTVKPTSSTEVLLRKRTQPAAAVWATEQATRTETQNPAYGLVRCPTFEIYAEVDVSFAELEDSVVDIEAELGLEFSEQFGVSEGNAIVVGDGKVKPWGITDAGQGVASTSTGNSGSIGKVPSSTVGSADAVIDMVHAVKSPYAQNGRFILARPTLGSVRKLKDTTGRYIWEPAIAAGMPSQILGYPYTEVPDMPLEAANSLSIGFGDWKRAYTIVDRLQMAVTRDPYTKAGQGQVKFFARRRVGGQIVLAEAVRLLKCG